MPRPFPADLTYLTDKLTYHEQTELVAKLDALEWSTVLKGRVQHFGYLYDYRARSVTSESYIGPIPSWLQRLGESIVALGIMSSLPDQVIANEYLPGQGISAHVDCVPCFGGEIVSVSLLSACEMIFRPRQNEQCRSLILEPDSCLLMAGEARYDWIHEIPARKSDIIEGIRVPRGRRVSLTFRKVKLETADR